jgi:DAACS family dicarboxylate/amino acid:cation (Na+ or H+) symporter
VSKPTRGQAEPDRFERELTTDLEDATPDTPRGLPLHTRILLGLAAGVVAGLAANAAWGGADPGLTWLISNVTEPVGTLFLRALLMIVVPLIASSLIVGVAGIGDIRRLGRVGLKSFSYAWCLHQSRS